MSKKDKPMELQDKLNNMANNLMSQVPNDIKEKTGIFVKEVAKAVQSELDQSEKLVADAENKVKAIEKQISKGGTGAPDEEKFMLKDSNCVTGTWQTLYRLSRPDTPLFCIRLKKHPDQPVVCGAHCVGFKTLSDGSVQICNGTKMQIER